MPSATEIPGYVAGTWAIDPVRSTLRFTVKHLGVQTVRGTLRVEGQIVVADDPTASAVIATIDLGSVNTKSKGRDKAIRAASLLNIANHPTAEYHSTGVTPDTGGNPQGFLLDGELTFMGITRRVPLRIQAERFIHDGGAARPIFIGRGQFTRSDFGLVYRARPRFLDRGIGQTVHADIRLEGSP
ncbi:YceI family protein [Mycobacterium sp. 050272]|uniref:YceI family protein n=1 Tax=Mycobacterium sp. 050272 TaxID=3142488 RepID=UPI003192A622